MKKLLLFALIVLGCVNVNAQGTWVSQATNFTDVSSGVRYVSAVDTNVVWICSYDGSGGGASRTDFSRTIDGGTTWTAANVTGVPATHDWSMIFGLDSNTAWSVFYNAVAGSGGGIWKTTDGGATWAQQGAGSIFNASSFPNVVHFWDANNGFAMGDPNPSNWFELYTTTDGGTTWTRTPQANIPAPLAGEYGIVGHYEVQGDTLWFDTNKGRVYRTVDRGLNWTVASTGITVPANGAIDICFYSSTNGLARLYNATTGGNTMRITSDGGTTWTAATPVGNFFGSDVQAVPGTPSRLVSTGAATGFIGSSYSDDGGLNWTTIETNAQRTALGVVDSSHMWTGGFTTSPTSDGIFRWFLIPVVQCTDIGISAGTTTASATQLCGGDTVTVTSTGVYAPTVGDFAGVSWVITTASISGSANPQNEPSLVASYTFTFPAPATSFRTYINDGSLINGTSIPYGTYYWTPVVFGNAIAASNPPVFLSDLVLDAQCLLTGTSVAVDVLDPLDPNCTGTGVNEVNGSLGMSTSLNGQNIDIRLNADRSGVAVIEVFDLSGRKVSGQTVPVYNGVNFIMVDASTFAAGTYLVKAQLNGAAGQSKIVKM
ncbi:MAG: T9SS type A sorting domain-containing protein [Bacteroidia bacterium]|nr:T9SS type A sorting domain-containing protein [Bacteroidia bacterium]